MRGLKAIRKGSRAAERRGGTLQEPARSMSTGEYDSALFGELTTVVEGFGRHVDILDLGPTTPANLMFWVRRGHRVTARDFLTRYARGDRGLGVESGRRFGAILAWNVLTFLPRPEARTLIAELQGCLRPGGALFAIFDGDGRREPSTVRYRIVGEGRLSVEQGGIAATPRTVTTSEIEALLGAFSAARISVMRHGSRESMVRRPRGEGS